jgi:hypothetical protein
MYIKDYYHVHKNTVREVTAVNTSILIQYTCNKTCNAVLDLYLN